MGPPRVTSDATLRPFSTVCSASAPVKALPGTPAACYRRGQFRSSLHEHLHADGHDTGVFRYDAGEGRESQAAGNR